MRYGKATIRGVWHIVTWTGHWQTGVWTTDCGRKYRRLAGFFGFFEDDFGRNPNGPICKHCLRARKK